VVFVAAQGAAEIAAVDTTTLTVVAHVPTGPKPRSLVFSNDGTTAFVTDEGGAKVTVIDAVAFTAEGDIAITEDSPMPSGPRPMGAVLSPDGDFLYVTCGRGGSVAIVDVASRKQIRSIDGVGDRPWGIAVSSDGKRLYTANGTSNDLSIVDIATGNVEKRVHIGGLPWGVVATVTRQRPRLGSSMSNRSKIGRGRSPADRR
jgi:YVTN family beta-propeller protein